VILAVAAGLAYRAVVETPVFAYGSDHLHQLLLARSVAEGAGFESGGSQHPDLSRPPLFPVLTALISRLCGDVEIAAQLLILLASSLVVVPLHFLARDTFGYRAGLAVLPLGAVSALAATAGLITEPLFIFLGLSAAAVTWRAARRRRTALLYAAGALAGACALARFEGLALIPALAVWAAVRTGRGRHRMAAGAGSALIVLVGVLSVYGPYVVWASAKLGRWAPAPGAQYLRDMRSLSDRLGLREAEGPHVPWDERAQYLLAPDGRRRVLETYFAERVILEADASLRPSTLSAETQRPEPRWVDLARRRASIIIINLKRLPYRLYTANLLPGILVALGAIGALTALLTRRTRRSLAYLATLAAASLAPVLSHLEARFLYLPFAFGLVVAAAGWGVLDRWLAAWRGSGRKIARPVIHLTLIALVAFSAPRHHTGHDARFQRSSYRQDLGPRIAAQLPPGPILAVQMHIPYWAGRPYRAIPVGDVERVIEYARSQGAAGLFFDTAADLSRRPHLHALLDEPPPPGLRFVFSEPLPDGEKALVFVLSEAP
jgi:4-amino-4-deoxy-L-arabinose transferase-like glycosyltransferase